MSSGFISEAELAEARQKRQEEWDRVRKADDPVEPPEEPYDSRSLYERLQEQKERKELEFEEAYKLKNMIKGLDDDEIDYLEFVDKTKIAADKKRSLEDEKELDDYRNRVATLHEKTYDKKLEVDKTKSKPKASSTSKMSSQTKLLKGVVVTKNESAKRKLSDASEESKDSVTDNKIQKMDKVSAEDSVQSNGTVENSIQADNINCKSGLVCVGILPGLGYYGESSSDENSSDLEQDFLTRKEATIDLLGRKIIKKDHD